MPPALPPSPRASLSVDVESWDILLGMVFVVFEAFNGEMQVLPQDIWSFIALVVESKIEKNYLAKK